MLNKIGALWRKEKDGKKFFSGQIDIGLQKVNVIVMPNTQKEKKDGTVVKNPPAYVIFTIDNTQNKKPATQKKVLVPDTEEED